MASFAQAALDWLIARKTDGRSQNAGIQSVLRLGLYQIFWLDRIPAHAAVHETVEVAKREGFGPKAGFVNAVLRGFLREFDATKKLLADLKTSDPAMAFSHPQWLVEKWEKRFGPESVRQLLEWNNTPPPTFARVNTLKTDAGNLLEKWRDENVEYDFVRRDFLQSRDRLPTVALAKAGEGADYNPETVIFELKSHPSLAGLESFRNGWFYVQDPGTLLATLELAPQAGETILDLCAAPGGKTTFMAQLMGNTGKIVASDISEERLKLLEENCARLGVTCVRPASPSAIPHSAIGIPQLPEDSQFDRILIDAPCSNTGVLRRRVDLRWRISSDEITRLRQTQLDLLELAAPQLKPGGLLVYSTCSLEPEENGSVVQEFLREHKQFKLEAERELLPFKDNVDGAFVARLRN
jgi:16S rRNA (cytosine967-C5)-methyltransferase